MQFWMEQRAEILLLSSSHSTLELLPEGQAYPVCSGICYGETVGKAVGRGAPEQAPSAHSPPAWPGAQNLSKSLWCFHLALQCSEGESPLSISKSKGVSVPEVLHFLLNHHKPSASPVPWGRSFPSSHPSHPNLPVTGALQCCCSCISRE